MHVVPVRWWQITLSILQAKKVELDILEHPERIFNMDESGLGKEQECKARVVAKKGASQPIQQQVHKRDQ